VSIQTLLTQFQARYPSGSVTSELLTIHENRFIVRAIVHLGNMTLATAMASASEIEQAEDRAKVRVLTSLGINAFPANSSSSTLPYSASISTPFEASAHSGEVPTHHPAPHPASLVTPTQEFEPKPKPVSPPVSTASATGSPADVTSIASKMTFGTGRSSASTEPISPESLSSKSLPSEPLSAFQSSPSFDAFDADPSGTAEEELSLPLEELTAPSPAPGHSPNYSFESEPSLQPSPSAKPSKPTSSKGKATRRKNEPAAEPDASSSTFSDQQSETAVDQIVDRSDVNAKIGVEMKRLGWTVEQGRSHLKRTYGKRSRQELEDVELLDFLDYLEAQPMPTHSPF
jgi:hypothetical protein